MTIANENRSGDAPMAVGSENDSEQRVSRRSVLGTLAPWSLQRKISLASAALFTGIATRGTDQALAHAGYGSQPACCTLARLDVSCEPVGTNNFACDHGGVQTLWYCCSGPYTWMCGECISGTGDCFHGDAYFCSYARLISQNNC
jgi:hypothetical protein